LNTQGEGPRKEELPKKTGGGGFPKPAGTQDKTFLYIIRPWGGGEPIGGKGRKSKYSELRDGGKGNDRP